MKSGWDKYNKGKVAQVKQNLHSELNVLNSASMDLGDIPNNIRPEEQFEDGFTTGRYRRDVTTGRIISHTGGTFVGKTYSMLSQIKQNPKGIEEEVNSWNIPEHDRGELINAMCEALKERRYHTVNELFAFGSELSIEETMYSEDNVEFFGDWYDKIHFIETYLKTEADDELDIGVDGPQSIRLLKKKFLLLERRIRKETEKLFKLNTALSASIKKKETIDQAMVDEITSLDERIEKINAKIVSVSQKQNRALGFDSMTSTLFWANESIRRKLVGRKVFSDTQQVPAPLWFWRNTTMEGFSLDLRKFNVQAWQTWKMARDREGHVLEDKPRWHDDTSGHLSSIWIHSYQTVDGELASVFKKCRPRRALQRRTFPYMTANLLLALCLGQEEHLGDRIKFKGSSEQLISASANDDDLIIDEAE